MSQKVSWKLQRDFLMGLKNYIEGRVYAADKKKVFDSLNSKALLEYFKGEKKQLEISYRAIENDRIHYYSANYINIGNSGQPMKVVAGFRNVDDIVVSQVNLRKEGLYKAYHSLSSVYLTMHRVDVISDTFHEIKGTNLVKESLVPGLRSYWENAYNVTTATTSPAYLDAMLKFVDTKTLSKRMEGKNSISMEFRSQLYGWCKATYIKEDEDANGNLWHVLYCVEVIEEAHQREQMLQKMADTDPLTGIFNRRSGVNKIQKELEAGSPGAFLIMDCDHFKNINDTYGHDVGDTVLIAVSKLLNEICDKKDIIMRLGGDEFAIFTNGEKTSEDASFFWTKMRKGLDELHLPGMEDTKISVSAGLYFIKREEHISFHDIYRLADKAMYASKKTDGTILTLAN
jgi:diguanylate cyclase